MMRLVLIGCSKTKRTGTDRRRGCRLTPAEMYTGTLFQKRLAYAEARGLPWMVLSAEYGLWRPDSDRKTYEATFAEKSPADRAVWHASVAYQLLHELWEPWEQDQSNPVLRPDQMTVEIHAGKDYAHPLTEILRAVGVNVELPCEGLGIGEQLALYTSGCLSTSVTTNGE